MLKVNTIFLTVCAFVFLSTGLVKADDISEMKEQIKALQETINAQQKTIEALNAKIQSIETRQEAQTREIKQVPELARKVDELKEAPVALLEGVNVGGHLKLYMLDRTEGERNGTSQHTNLSGGFHHLYLYLTKEIEEWLKLDVQTDLSVSASATPSVGSDISRATSASTTYKIHQAFFTALLPNEAELKVGIFNPMFSEEYAKETWWHELYHQNKGLEYLQSWHDHGIELYKNFDFDKYSLPVYLSVLGGNTTSSDSRFIDNNESKTVLLHIAPELFQTKLRLLGSLAYGKWDNKDEYDSWRSLAGFDWKYQKFNLTSEYIYNRWDSLVTTGTITADGKREGYYIRGLYNFTDKWVGLIKYSHAELYKTGSATMKSDNYDTTTLAIDYFLTPSSTIIAQYSYIDGERSDGSENIEAHRATLGWRTTF